MSVYRYQKEYDVIVIGGGHAGIEAALAASRMGCRTLMLSINLDTIGQMSCNPAIGGVAKGHIVREIDALGGEMGIATDMTGLQFRMLNTKKGPSVWSPRAQCDKKAYQFRMKWVCERQPFLDLKQGQATKLLWSHEGIHGVETSNGVQYIGKTLIITTGTFLMGLMHIGANQLSGGRAGESAAIGLSGSLIELGIELQRLKTGTPPRLLKKSIDFTQLEVQPGDEPISYFSYWIDELFHVEQNAGQARSAYPPGSILALNGGQVPCHLTHTTDATHKLVMDNLNRSPMYSGVIDGIGPRYCPSIEDKFVRFKDKERHQIFLEPEGIHTDEIYVNGLSTCLPFDVQVELVRTLVGCENSEIMRPAYAVEYDFAPPTQLMPSLETKVCKNLFLAGQINGTSGYEEAAGQGIMSGINAARKVNGIDPVVLRRDQAYIGVMIDDLVTKGTSEPYRMFTSRAEYRLLLRQDNADIRLSELGRQIGLLPEQRYARVEFKRTAFENEVRRLNKVRIGQITAAQLLRRPEVRYHDLEVRCSNLADDVVEQVELHLKYSGYIERQDAEVRNLREVGEKRIPSDTDYLLIRGLKTEAREKLSRIRPMTMGQASRIPGISSSDIALLAIHIKQRSSR